VRSLIDRIEQSGGAAKAARFGGETGGVGMMFAVHPEIDVLEKIVGGAPVSLVYDPSLRRFVSRKFTTTLNRAA
jgi:hypothetical protein